ncbi:MAG: MFS transporter [Chloroflexi bacterium]|nr:MFS transporter [Chloroflexota bacterium]
MRQLNAASVIAWPSGVDRRGGLWLLSISATLFVLMLPASSYIAAIPDIKTEWGLNNSQAGLVFSAFLAGYAASALLILPLTDRLQPRHIFVGSAVISVVAHILFPLLAQGMLTGILVRAVAGVGLLGMYMPGLRIVSERFSQQGRGLAIGLFVTAQYFANSASLAATGALMAKFDWEEAYLLMALGSAAGLPLAYLLVRRHRTEPGLTATGRIDLTVLRNAATRYLIFGYSLHAAVLFAVRVWLPAFLVAVLVGRGVGDDAAIVKAATYGGLALTVGSLGPVMGGLISDRWGRPTSAAAIFALSGACSWLIGWTGDFPWPLIVAIAVVYGWAIAADSAIYSTGVTEVAKPDRLGSTMAVQAFMGLLGGIVGPILMGLVLDVTDDSFRWGFSSLGVVALVAIAALLRLRYLERTDGIVRKPSGRAS